VVADLILVVVRRRGSLFGPRRAKNKKRFNEVSSGSSKKSNMSWIFNIRRAGEISQEEQVLRLGNDKKKQTGSTAKGKERKKAEGYAARRASRSLPREGSNS